MQTKSVLRLLFNQNDYNHQGYNVSLRVQKSLRSSNIKVIVEFHQKISDKAILDRGILLFGIHLR